MNLRLRNNTNAWGAVTIIFHWVSAAAVPGLFALGLWMVDLGYYSAWYYRAPHIHKGVGLLLFGLTIVRLAWRLSHPSPAPLTATRAWRSPPPGRFMQCSTCCSLR